jgi:hypothetical protein
MNKFFKEMILFWKHDPFYAFLIMFGVTCWAVWGVLVYLAKWK